MTKKDILAKVQQKSLILCSWILLEYEHTSFVTMATYWLPDLSDIKGFASHLWRSILIFADDPSSA